MNILQNSDIKSLISTIYLNNAGQGTNLFYSSEESRQYYFLLRDSTIVANGVMKGYRERGASLYKYRYDFFNFIKINNQNILAGTTLDTYGSYKIVGDNSSTLHLYVGSNDILTQNINNELIDTYGDGTLILYPGKYYTDLLSDNRVDITFVDAKSLVQDFLPIKYRLETGKPTIGSYTPITVYGICTFTYTFKDKYGDVIYSSPYPQTSTTEKGYSLYMLMIPSDCTTINYTLAREDMTTVNENIEIYDICSTPYYFWNDNGAFDVIRLTGVRNIVELVDKKYINVNGTQIPITIDITQQIKHNSGFQLPQEQIYSLIKAPIVDEIKFGQSHNILNINLTSFEGFNGTNLSNRNIEFIFTRPKDSKRVTGKTIGFTD